jgi:uncharacterized membrane protein
MPELSIQHIERIALEVKKQEIVFSHLADELIDHICCDVEFEMQDGLTFYEAYSKVKQKINPRRLKEIQEETLYAIDTKYRNMKNTMKISGITGTVLLGFASLFKIQHWPGAGVMITLGAVILAFVFLPAALGILWKETRNRNKLFLFISAFFASTFFILGILFKIQHWSGAGIILVLATVLAILFFIPALLFSLLRDQKNRNKATVYIFGSAGLILFVAGLLCKIQHWPMGSLLMVSGMSILCVIAFPWYTWLTWKEESHISSRFLYLVIGMLTIIIPGALINLKLQQSYEEGFYKHQEQQQAMYNYLFRNNNSLMIRYQDSLSYPQIELLHAKTVGLLSLIGNIQTKMVQESEGEPGKPALSQDQISQTETGTEIQYLKLSKPFHPAPVRDFIAPGCSSREELNSSLNEYMKYISGQIPVEYSQKYTGILNPSVFLPATIDECENISLMSGLHSLELLKNSLLAVESNMFTIIVRHK